MLRALADARTERMHFAHFFVGPRLLSAGGGQAVVELAPDPALLDATGEFDAGTLLLAVDFALTVALQAEPGIRRRISTASLNLQYSGLPIQGVLRIEAMAGSAMAGTTLSMDGVQASVTAAGRELLKAGGVYVRFPEPDNRPVLESLVDAPPSMPLSAQELDDQERWVHRRIRTLARSGEGGLAARLWDYRQKPGPDGRGRAAGAWQLGPHVRNRYGATNGGLLCAFAAASAAAALEGRNRIIEFNASLVSPGKGDRLRASSLAVHAGRNIATVRTTVRGAAATRPVLEALSLHARLA